MDPMDHLALLLKREDYVEVINTTSMIINSIPKDEDPLYFAHFFDLWFFRLQAALRLVENKDETYLKLAEMEAAAFDDSQYSNLYKQFFPSKFEGQTGSILPFRLRLLSLQIVAKVAASTGNGKEINTAISKLFALMETTKEVLKESHDFVETEEEKSYFLKIWERRKIAAENAVSSAFVQANNHTAALVFLDKLGRENCPAHLLEGTWQEWISEIQYNFSCEDPNSRKYGRRSRANLLEDFCPGRLSSERTIACKMQAHDPHFQAELDTGGKR